MIEGTSERLINCSFIRKYEDARLKDNNISGQQLLKQSLAIYNLSYSQMLFLFVQFWSLLVLNNEVKNSVHDTTQIKRTSECLKENVLIDEARLPKT